MQNPLNTKYPELIYRTGDLVYCDSDGRLFYKGRNDTLIKHLGYRIELAEIEHIIVGALKLAENACVLYNEAIKEIVVIYERESEIDVPNAIKLLSLKIPKYMIPKKFIKIKKIPMNNNGKIDRLALKNSYL